MDEAASSPRGDATGGAGLAGAARLATVTGLPIFVAAGLAASAVEMIGHRYLQQGFGWLSLLLSRRVLNSSLAVLAVVIPLAALSMLVTRRGRPSLPAAVLALAHCAGLSWFLFVEFFPWINAAVRTSPTVDSIQALLGPAGDFLGTREGKILILAGAGLLGGAAVMGASVRLLESRRGARLLRSLPWVSSGRRAALLAGAAAAAPLALNAVAWAVPAMAAGTDLSSRPNVLLISIDTVRADHLGAWGHFRETAPHLTRLARRGILYSRAVAQAPWTLPSMATVHTGLYPSEHGAEGPRSKLGDRFATLAEHLANAGYRTSAVISWQYVSRTHGFDQGFLSFDQELIGDDGSEIVAPQVTGKAIGALDAAAGRPLFLWVHYAEPHGAYVNHPDLSFEDGYDGRLPDVVGLDSLYAVRSRLQERDLRYVRDIYDEEIASVDESIGRLMDALASRGLEERTLIAVLGDHGEEFMERRHFGHARHLHQELIHVPLLVVDPARPELAGSRVEPPVELRSVWGTVLRRCGIAVRSGPDLIEAASSPGGLPPAVSEYVDQWGIYPEQRAALAGRWKMIRTVSDGTYQLYDLAGDPGERDDLAAGKGEEERLAAATLGAALEAFATGAVHPGEEAALSDEEIRRLRTLGYLD